jgi:phosphate transport system protein
MFEGPMGGTMTRSAHLEQFDRLAGLLATMSRATTALVRTASAALLTPDDEAARLVAGQRAAVADIFVEIDALVPELLALHQPVASDMRLVVAALRINADMDRMAALGLHIANIALARYPNSAVPAAAWSIIAAMADAATNLTNKSSIVLATRDPVDAMQVELDDDEPDALHGQLFALLAEGWTDGVQAAIDVAMLGRFLERLADHAVNVARQVTYMVVGDVAHGRP